MKNVIQKGDIVNVALNGERLFNLVVIGIPVVEEDQTWILRQEKTGNIYYIMHYSYIEKQGSMRG